MGRLREKVRRLRSGANQEGPGVKSRGGGKKGKDGSATESELLDKLMPKGGGKAEIAKIVKKKEEETKKEEDEAEAKKNSKAKSGANGIGSNIFDKARTKSPGLRGDSPATLRGISPSTGAGRGRGSGMKQTGGAWKEALAPTSGQVGFKGAGRGVKS